MWKKKGKGFLNILFSLISVPYFLVQNGYLVFPGTIEYGSFSPEFRKYMIVWQIIVIVSGIGIVIINFRDVNQYSGLAKWGRIFAIVGAVSDCVFLLLAGKMAVFCALSLAGAVMMLMSKEE